MGCEYHSGLHFIVVQRYPAIIAKILKIAKVLLVVLCLDALEMFCRVGEGEGML